MDLNKLAQEIIEKNNSEKNEFKDLMDEKIFNFCEFIESKNIPGLNNNIVALKLIYQVGALKLFIQNYVIPRKDKIENPTLENQKEILWLISPDEDIDKILNSFSEDEKNKIIIFLKFLLDISEII
jgi:hypothetical protein